MAMLYLTKLPPGSQLDRIRVVRSALRAIRPDASAADAVGVIDRLAANNYALLGSDDDDTVIDAAAAIIQSAGGLAMTDLDTDAIDRRRARARRRAEQKEKTPEEVFAEGSAAEEVVVDAPEPTEQPVASPAAYSTAMALIMVANGNPLTASAYAAMLARTTGDPTTYREAIESMFRTFPWLEQQVADQGLLP